MHASTPGIRLPEMAKLLKLGVRLCEANHSFAHTSSAKICIYNNVTDPREGRLVGDDAHVADLPAIRICADDER